MNSECKCERQDHHLGWYVDAKTNIKYEYWACVYCEYIGKPHIEKSWKNFHCIIKNFLRIFGF